MYRINDIEYIDLNGIVWICYDWICMQLFNTFTLLYVQHIHIAWNCLVYFP